ncbi:MAG: hypothetical protein ACE145_18620 [Terriglobia bacterium]
MTEPNSAPPLRAWRLILVPGLITLAITILRLSGELLRWPEPFFNRTMGLSVVAITWLPPLFGIYFALKLDKAGNPPKAYLRAIGYAFLGVLALIVLAFAPSTLHIEHGFYGRLVFGWTIFAIAALLTFRGWPALFKTLLAYGYAARIPVAVIMFFAYAGEWGTHYDAVPGDAPALGLIAKYLWLGFFPQLVLWVAFTILTGMIAGTIAAGIARVIKIDRGVPVQPSNP